MSLTAVIFALLFGVAMLLALFKHPLYGLHAYVANFYLHPPSRWWAESLPDLRWSLLAAAVTMLSILLRQPRNPGGEAWYSTAPGRIMILFVAWFCIGGFWALDPAQHYPQAIILVKYLLVFYMIYRLVDSGEKLTQFLLMHIAGCMYLGYVALGSFSGGRLDGVGGPGIDDSNTLGMQLATAVICAGILTLNLRGWKQYFCVLAMALAMNAIVMTGSRGAFLGLVAGGMTLAFLKPFAYRRRFYVFAALGLLMIGYVASETFWDRMGTLKAVTSENQQELDSSAQSRIAMFEAQMHMAGDFPLGSGHRGSEVLSPKYLNPIFMTEAGVRSSHNVFMTVLVEQGVPGILLFFVLIGWVASALIKLRSSYRKSGEINSSVQLAAIGGALTVVLVSGIFADFSKCEVQIWMLALLCVLKRQEDLRVVHNNLASTEVGSALGPVIARRMLKA